MPEVGPANGGLQVRQHFAQETQDSVSGVTLSDFFDHTRLEKEFKSELDGPARAFFVRDRTKG